MPATFKNSGEDLDSVCRRCAIPQDVRAKLDEVVGYLKTFKSELLPTSKTATQRAAAFKLVEKRAVELSDAITALEFLDRSALDNEYFVVDEPDFEAAHSLASSSHVFDIAGLHLPALAKAAKAVRGRIDGAGKSGAPKSAERHADFIRCIAQALRPTGIPLTYSGDFSEICGAVYLAAGVVPPDRAVRFFLKHIRPELKAAGYCL